MVKSRFYGIMFTCIFHFHIVIFSVLKQFYFVLRNTCNCHLTEWLFNGDLRFLKWFQKDCRAYLYVSVYEMSNEQAHSKHFQVVQLGVCLDPTHYTTPRDNFISLSSHSNQLQRVLTTVVLVVDPFLSLEADMKYSC